MVIISEDQYDKLTRYKSGADQVSYKVDGEDYIVKKPKEGIYRPYQLTVYRMMEKYPQFFAKIYSISATEVKQELLDDKSFFRDFLRLFYAVNKISPIKGEKLTDRLFELISDIEYPNDEIKKIAVSLDKSNFNFFNKLYQWFDAFNRTRNWGVKDIHPQQFGYDKQGRIKLFDI